LLSTEALVGSPFARKNRHWSLSCFLRAPFFFLAKKNGEISVGETPLIGETYDFQKGFFQKFLSKAKLNDQDSTKALLFLEIVLEN